MSPPVLIQAVDAGVHNPRRDFLAVNGSLRMAGFFGTGGHSLSNSVTVLSLIGSLWIMTLTEEKYLLPTGSRFGQKRGIHVLRGFSKGDYP